MARTYSTDTTFLAGLNSVVAVEFDVNHAGGPRSALAGVAPKYLPVTGPDTEGLDAEPVRLVFKSAANWREEDRRGAVARGRVLFGGSVDLTLNHRLVWADPGTGRTRYLYADGASRNAHEQNHHWICDFVEYVA